MDDDMLFFGEGDDTDYSSEYENPLTIREIGDFELRFYFNPELYDARKINVGPLITHASLMAGISKPDLSRIKYGEIVIRLNPAISDAQDIRYIKRIFTEYFDTVKPVTL